MQSQAEFDRERDEARRKAELDCSSGLKVAPTEGWKESLAGAREEARAGAREEARAAGREVGLAEGRREGKIEMIHFCESYLNRPETPTAELAGLTLDELTHRADALLVECFRKSDSKKDVSFT